MASGLVPTMIVGGSQGLHGVTVPDMTVDNLYLEGSLYFGADDTDGTWRVERNDGVDVDRYDTDEWNERAHHG